MCADCSVRAINFSIYYPLPASSYPYWPKVMEDGEIQFGCVKSKTAGQPVPLHALVGLGHMGGKLVESLLFGQIRQW